MLPFFKSEEWKLLWIFYATRFISGLLSLLGAFWVIYLSFKGFTFTQVSISIAAFFIGQIIFEIPTGAIADYFGRKVSVVLAWIFSGIFFTLIPFVNSFFLIALLFFLTGAFTTLASGADEAWVVDYLKQKKRKDLIQKYYIKMSSIGRFGGIFGPLVGSFIVLAINMDFLWIIDGLGAIFLGLLLAVFGKEYFKRGKYKAKKALRKTFENARTGIDYAKMHPALAWLIIASTFFYISLGIAGLSWQPLFNNMGIAIALFGVIYSLASAFSAFAPFSVNYLLKKFKERHLLSLIAFSSLALLALVYFLPYIYVVVFIFIIAESLFTMEGPVEGPYFQRFVPSKIRATVRSVSSMITKTGIAIAFLLAGILIDSVGPKTTIALGSLFLMPAIFFYLRIKD